ncbi:TAXI family TRAP transporter solute-binding subunit [Rhizobium sp. KVB221]|uniref:TAXI family TRAP transporter solute-binding subunit n=1 Tax=Rhizobium setariae TaxID=2801340 RepID=A0A936YLW5_9HYPH|nr:TAXI family TRAP transporter solute-binding subunit [Rhizobium setariae]
MLKKIAPALILALAFCLPANAAEIEKSIMTGGAKGTYIKIGRDIAALGRECGQTLNVVESAGSLENFIGVRNRKNTQFGIVQNDVLEYLKTFEANDAEIQKAVKGVRIMFPLYNEEVHILAKSDVPSLEGLAGKKVAIGVKDSGTYLTATLIMDILQIKGVEKIAINPDEALPKLQAGEIDALFYVAGAPAALFQGDAIDGSKFHLLPITEAPLLATYIPSRIDAGTYDFQKSAVDVVSVKAVLMTYDYDKKRNAYHRDSCKAVADFSSLILNNLEALQRTGHPKWKNVDLTALPPGWKVGVCVKEGMAMDYKPACIAKATPASDESGENDEYLNLLKQRLKK